MKKHLGMEFQDLLVFSEYAFLALQKFTHIFLDIIGIFLLRPRVLIPLMALFMWYFATSAEYERASVG